MIEAGKNAFNRKPLFSENALNPLTIAINVIY
jgi:hypothetical protein